MGNAGPMFVKFGSTFLIGWQLTISRVTQKKPTGKNSPAPQVVTFLSERNQRPLPQLSLICVRFIHTKYIDCLCLFIALSVLIELWHCTDTIEPRSNEPQSNEIRDSTKFLLSPYPASIEDNVFYLSI